MQQFNRTAKVFVSGEEIIDLSSLACAFRVVKHSVGTNNTMELTIYNLSDETRKKIVAHKSVVSVNAGYDGETSLLFIGTVWATRFRPGTADSSFVIDVKTGEVEAQKKIAFGLPPNSDVQEAYEIIRKNAGLVYKKTGKEKSKRFPSGMQFVGTVRDALEMLSKSTKCDWSIQDDGLQILEVDSGVVMDPIEISSDTGLIGSPDRISKISSNKRAFKDAKGKTKSVKEEIPGINFSCLLNPKIYPGSRLVLFAKEYAGKVYIARTVTHDGVTLSSGDWVTKVEATEDPRFVV